MPGSMLSGVSAHNPSSLGRFIYSDVTDEGGGLWVLRCRKTKHPLKSRPLVVIQNHGSVFRASEGVVGISLNICLCSPSVDSEAMRSSVTVSGSNPRGKLSIRHGCSFASTISVNGGYLFWDFCLRLILLLTSSEQEDRPNLSILLSRGKETNKDSLSKGD